MLSERQRLILNAIVDDYIRSAEPVGSRSISKRGDVGYSPATIRNEMSDLEELGYLEQPHTSAGRIPSHKGYRYYVDHLIHLKELPKHEIDRLKRFFAERMQQQEAVIRQVAMILAEMTNYTSLVLEPELYHTSLKHMQIVPLNERQAVMIIVTNTGHVEDKLISLPQDVPVSEIEKLVNILNAKLSGVSMMQLTSKLYNELSSEIAKHVSKYQELIRVLDDALAIEEEGRVYLSGTTNIMNQPEFRDVEKVKSLFALLEEQDTLAKMLTPSESGIHVRIGSENNLDAIHNCSLITATYSIDGQTLGTIGILGPTRMEYSKVISLMKYFSEELSNLLSNIRYQG
ncbi:heat-inducible transcription repressor HrcA [Insulibacter thermoxylanivorax]|uniref:Heat-inducible transcription repressor HrcA n=1 Tax=Insulibacter thermoxylanivorax TaxID=2749268 RepID=A0A916QF49_9BACL|nr:heat-inducible transcriptional repressor HrcA [Insulibacter thermoxylanivorax]GFR37381.1 heat-inducible transcription repressor HrcA [Insulibacter thermoxylanivorax]